MPQPYKLFTIYAREDAPYLEELRGQLRPLEHAGRIQVWSDREINPGTEWEREIVHNLDNADIILILVSAAYYNSAYIHDKEIKHAIHRHERGEAKVLPVILRPCHFSEDPVISRLQVLPTDGKPVTDRRHWAERDEAWVDVVAGVKRTLDLLDAAVSDKERAMEQEKRDAQRREQEQAARRTEHNIWHQATSVHNIPAYENYLARYPRGEYAREARIRIKELKRKDAAPLPLKRYTAIGGGVFALLLAIWLVPKMFSGNSDGVTVSHPVTTATVKKSGLEMVQVQGGTFTMGSPDNEKDRRDDECQHQVSVGAFSIGKYEVTQADWREIMGNNPSNFINCDVCPVEMVSWNDIQAFLKKINARYPGQNYRLPTEAEWEYAARGGHKAGNTYYTYAGSNSLNEVAWHGGNSGDKTHPVGTKKANPLGLHDMNGNVWEWCQDTYKPYACDRNNKAEGSYRVLRGGSWLINYPQFCRVAYRGYSDPTNRSNYRGFRLAAFFAVAVSFGCG